jgi:hypothetical protein
MTEEERNHFFKIQQRLRAKLRSAIRTDAERVAFVNSRKVSVTFQKDLGTWRAQLIGFNQISVIYYRDDGNWREVIDAAMNDWEDAEEAFKLADRQLPVQEFSKHERNEQWQQVLDSEPEDKMKSLYTYFNKS